MSKFVLVPVEPTDEMKMAARNAPLPMVLLDSMTARQDLMTVATYKAMLAAAPVPPAGGEVEVLAWVDRDGDFYKERCYPDMKAVILLSDHRAHVTRLQAELKEVLHTSVKEDVFDVVCKERDALKAEVERLNKDWSDETAEHRITQVNRDTWRSNYHEAQSELTKARECIANTLGLLRADKSSHAQYAILRYQGFPSDQPAPAVSQTNSSGKAHCPHCGICHTSDETCKEAMSRIDSLSAPVAKGDHILYRDGDSIGCIPESILDRNGQVALDMCTVCGKAESELDGPCQGEQVKP